MVGVVVNDQLRLDAPVCARLARRTAKLLRAPRRRPRPRCGWSRTCSTSPATRSAPATATRTAAAGRAAALAAEDGLALDPVYTAKAMAGLLALREQGRLTEPVLFIHTDGPR